ncbi:MAG: hypothetical protein Q4G16_10850 [Cruoricaptor ignavus]|nr:hypothetical protein [Cruoricaptor ignavus]
MKKAFIYLATAVFFVSSCNRDNNTTARIQEVDNLTTQNTNDDAAIAKYLDEHYLDSQGKIVAFSSTSTDDDNNKKLSELNPQKLSSGVIVIKREDAQPTSGTAIGSTDVLRLMHKTTAFLSQDDDGIKYTSEISFANTIETTGVPEVDPSYYYVKNNILTSTGNARSYYEIEGLQEGMQHFESFDKADSENYNLQGVIIVPSRAAFARDTHYPYGGVSWRNRTFVFNFQVYKSSTRTTSEE